MFYFSGHGYISESKVARIDEKAAWFEHFPQLKNRTNNISYMDHSDHFPVKTNFIRKACREHIVGAKQKGKDYNKMTEDFMKRFDLPKTWFDDAFDAKLNAQDSTEDANEDLHIEDFKQFGYQPNTPVVMIDACFCGSFHRDDCIADEYIFQLSHTVAVIANSVNVLQDKWSDRLIGLIANGGCVGDIVRFSTFLESHLIGDPTFCFVPEEGSTDVNTLMANNGEKEWLSVLNKTNVSDLKAIAIFKLAKSNLLSNKALLDILKESPYSAVRMEAFLALKKRGGDDFATAMQIASHDNFELIQRFSVNEMQNYGGSKIIPSLVRLISKNNPSARVQFNAIQALQFLPGDEISRIMKQQLDSLDPYIINKEDYVKARTSQVTKYANYWDKDILKLVDNKLDERHSLMQANFMRIYLPAHLIPSS